jgi:hypothetical protein
VPTACTRGQRDKKYMKPMNSKKPTRNSEKDECKTEKEGTKKK